MGKSTIKNVWEINEPILIQLATHDVGKGYSYLQLSPSEEATVEDNMITDQARHLAKATKHRKPAITIIPIQEQEKATTVDIAIDLNNEQKNVLQEGYVCNICNKSYKTENGLAKHMETHEEELLRG